MPYMLFYCVQRTQYRCRVTHDSRPRHDDAPHRLTSGFHFFNVSGPTTTEHDGDQPPPPAVDAPSRRSQR